MEPVVDRLEKQYEGKVEFRRYDVEKDAEGSKLMQQFKAQYVPTFVFINSDGTTVAMKVGEQSESQMEKQLDALK